MTVLRSVNYPRPPKRNKYGAKRTVVDGISFASKKEAAHYCKLKLLKKAGEIKWFCRQPIYDLPGFTYRPDFIVCDRNGKIEVQDVKGFRTRDYDLKRRAMQAVWNIEVVEVIHADFRLLSSL